MNLLTVGDCEGRAVAPSGSVGVCAALLLLDGMPDVDSLSVVVSTISSNMLVIVVSTQLVRSTWKIKLIGRQVS